MAGHWHYVDTEVSNAASTYLAILFSVFVSMSRFMNVNWRFQIFPFLLDTETHNSNSNDLKGNTGAL